MVTQHVWSLQTVFIVIIDLQDPIVLNKSAN